MKIVAMSDSHNGHDAVHVPECDILIHAGDESYRGNQMEIERFAAWFEKQPAKHLVWVPGNHSVGFEAQYPLSRDWIKKMSPRTHILINDSVTIEGIKIWGSPVTPWFHDWAYNVQRGPEIQKVWDMIPSDTNVVVTHGPPYNIMDEVDRTKYYGQRVGCINLANTLMLRVKPKLHIFGHIHEGHGIEVHSGTTYVNAAIMTEDYEPLNRPIEIDYEKLP